MRALLRLAFSGPGAVVRRGLLAVVVKHLVALDCEIRWQDIAFAGVPAYTSRRIGSDASFSDCHWARAAGPELVVQSRIGCDVFAGVPASYDC